MKPTRLTECGNWVLERFPITKFWNEHMAHYYAPRIPISGTFLAR